MPQFNEGNINSYLVPSGSLTGSLSNSGTLTGQIAIGSGGGTTDYNDLTNKPQINSVTLSGNKTTADLNISYNDLDDKPTIPAAQVNSDWNAESGVAEILNKPTLATVATSGSYNDLTNKPTIPEAQVNSDWNASSGVAEILNKPTIPTSLDDLSDVEIDSPPFMDYTWLMYNVNHSKWEPRVFQPYLGSLLNVRIDSTLTDGQSIVYEQISNKWINAKYDYDNLNNKPTLATVATSGSYNDLSDKPTIPTACSISRGSSMPSSFPVPSIVRRGNTVIVRFGILLPAGTYSSSDTLWNYSPAMVGLPALTFPVYGSGEVNLIKINTDGTITMNATKTFAADTWLIGEAVFLTDG